MVIILKIKEDVNKVKKMLSGNKNKFDAQSFYGALKSSEHALDVQLRKRNEWNKDAH